MLDLSVNEVLRMPYVVYLESLLTQKRINEKDENEIKSKKLKQ